MIGSLPNKIQVGKSVGSHKATQIGKRRSQTQFLFYYENVGQ